MARDLFSGLLFSLLLHLGFLWYAGHAGHRVVSPEPLPTSLSLYVQVSAGPGKPTPNKTPKVSTRAQRTLQRALPGQERRTYQTVKTGAATEATPPEERISFPEPILRTPEIQSSLRSGRLIRKQPLRPKLPPTLIKKSGPLDVERPFPDPMKRPTQTSPPLAGPAGNDPIFPLERILATRAIPHGRGKDPEKENRALTSRGEGAPLVEAAPDYAVNPKPRYPSKAIQRGYEGTVTLLVEVLEDGSVREIRIVGSSGHGILDRSALRTVRKWRFIPGKRGEKTVAMKVKVPIVFRLGKGKDG
ncbi:MAG: energy transducer TonB [Deltaproteobacteria bacterium]|nr:energy transducer TonB [Deltaproteobacteria bacterium]